MPLSARIPSFGKSLALFRILLPGESLVLARSPPPICESLALRQKPRPGEASPPCENAAKEDATHSKKRTEDCYSTGRLLRRGFCLGEETALGTRLVRPRTFRSRRSRPDKGFAAPGKCSVLRESSAPGEGCPDMNSTLRQKSLPGRTAPVGVYRIRQSAQIVVTHYIRRVFIID